VIRRGVEPRVLAALSDTPVVLINGPRQAGKSTLARHIASTGHPARYLTLDDVEVLAGAKSDPSGFIADLDGPVVIDEIQRAPELFLPIKASVDRDRRPGRFLLTGSAQVLLLPGLSDSLAGRMEPIRLWPLTQGELAGGGDGEDFTDRVFAKRLRRVPAAPLSGAELAARIVAGGFPEGSQRPKARRRDWFGAYVTTMLERTVREIADIERLREVPRLLNVLAGRTGTPLNTADLSRTLAIPATTLKRYLAVLETAFLVHTIPAWTSRVRKRLLKSPKVHLVDTGLAGHLIGQDARGLPRSVELWGAFVESFVAMELLRQADWSRIRPGLYHFRTDAGAEVDLVLESGAGEVVGVEVKASRTVGGDDFRGLRMLAEVAGPRFRRGVLLYLGQETVPFGPNLYAMPLSSLWAARGLD
jgi:predicted AAA+ superfamily ATPase